MRVQIYPSVQGCVCKIQPYTSNTYPAVQDYTSEYNLHTQARDIKIVQHCNKKKIPKTKIKIISEYT